LTASYGPALVDRAVLDALCRARVVSFWQAIRANLPGIGAAALAPDLAGFDVPAFLAALSPASSIAARHTVGLIDPLTSADLSTRVGDGLPETLEDVIAVYGNRHFKAKLSGDVDADLARLTGIAAILDRLPHAYQVTLDGNEQFADAEAVVALWRKLVTRAALARFAASVLWIEQPLPRDLAEREPIQLAQYKPVLIDESDATLDAFPAACARGYSGVSSKSCKGFYKSLLNAARCAHWNRERSNPRFFVSGEDLSMQAGLAVQQDLALVGLLGLDHVERNGHHYVDGFAGAGADPAE
jgi:L-alanine-DL-glutamate epimerase-like enolase superfamily enzyme